MQPLAAQTTSQDEAFGIRETKSDTNLRGLLQHTLSSLAMGWPLKAWGRRRSSRIVQSTDSGVEEEVAPFVSDRSLFYVFRKITTAFCSGSTALVVAHCVATLAISTCALLASTF
eukprot:5796-Heterococcus_DN1.PRE.3